MSHNSKILDMDSCFIIDPKSRTISKESNDIDEVIQFDHNSERYTFKIPRIVEGHDMIECNIIRIHYINTGIGTSVSTRASNTGIYKVDDLSISPEDEDYLVFTWLLSQNGTQLAGNITFKVEFICFKDNYSEEIDLEEIDLEMVEYMWNTHKYSSINVGEGLNCATSILEQKPDIILQFEKRLSNIETSKHDHVNKEILDKFTEVDGKLLYDGDLFEDGHTPIKGIDYYTEEDKVEMINAVLEALPIAEGATF